MSIRKPLTACALAAALLLTPVAGTTFAATAAAAPIVQVQNADASAAAANYLAAQLPAGHLVGWDGVTPDVSNSIDAALALVASQTNQATVSLTTEYLLGEAAAFTANGTKPALAGKLAVYADAVGIDPTNFGGVNLIDAMHTSDASLAGNAYSLALLVMGMARSDVAVPSDVLDALLATQDADGAFGFPGWGADADSTALAAQALFLLTDDATAQTAAQAASDYLAGTANVDGYWDTYSPANTAGLAIPVLELGGHPTGAALTWLLGQQLADGGFPPQVGAGYSDAYATAQALPAVAGTSFATVVAGLPAQPEPETPAPDNSGDPAPSVTTPAASVPSYGTKPTALPRTGVDGFDLVPLALLTVASAAVGLARRTR